MSRFRSLLAVTLLFGVGAVRADDAKPTDPKAVKKARQEARQKAAAEAEAKAKAEADAKAAAEKAKAEGEARIKAASVKPKDSPAQKIDYRPLTKTIDAEISKRLLA